ncbi:MAG TPA: hypothetical protein V6D28_08600 [Leptolyngbyaceae cyanobacterium]
MSNPSDKSSSPKTLLPVRTIVLAGIGWAVLALLFFLLFSFTTEQERPVWYIVGTYVFEQLAYVSAAILCFRNWRSPQIVSGRNVWLAFGLGMLFYFIGNLMFGYWELALKLEPDISLADPFFIATYICLGWGMIQAVTSRRLNLEKWQWGVVAGIAAIGFVLAYTIAPPDFSAQAQAAPAPTSSIVAQASPAAKPAPKPPAAQQAPKPKPAATAKPSVQPKATPSPQADTAPSWIEALDEQFKFLVPWLNLFYVISDVVLLILATMLLLAFWGGRFSQSWRMIAGAALSLYIADMWLKWAERNLENYQSGSLPEVFWVFSGVLFAIGAALEYDTSSRSRRGGSRRRA